MEQFTTNGGLVERFERFFDEFGGPEPTGDHVRVSYADLAAFDADLAATYLDAPRRTRAHAELALRDVGDGDVRVRLVDLPEDRRLSPDAVRTDDHVGELVSVRGYVDAVDDVSPRLVSAAYECRSCGATSVHAAESGDTPDPGACDECEREDVRFDAANSAFVDARRLRLASLPESDDAASLDVELTGELVARGDRGDRLDVVGVLDVRPVDDGFERVLEATHLTALDPRRAGLFDGTYLDTPTATLEDGDDATESLAAVVDRSRAVLADRDLNEREVREKVVAPFLHAIGWTPTLPAVRMRTTPPGLSSAQAVDYALGDEGAPAVVVCVERSAQSLGTVGDRLRTAMRTTGATLGILTNGHQYQFFVRDAEGPGEVCILTCSLDRLPDHGEVLRAFSRECAGDAAGPEAFADLVAEAQDRELRVETDDDPGAFDLGDRITSTIDLIEQQTTDEGAPVERVFAVLKADQELADAVDHDVTDDFLLNHVARLREAGRVQSVRDGFLRAT
jgi:hypothetical protein